MKKATPFLYITLVFSIAFLPILSFVFALKNDFFLGYFPPKFLLSETISSGQFPLWNPYISFGLPFYADMNGAYWNPITWIIAGTTGYNAYTITLELLLYVLLGGIGMYKLAKLFTDHKSLHLTAGFAYMCNGFVIGHLQHLNWISCSAFLPWCVWGLMSINTSATIRNYIYTVIAFYFFISASHPGMIIGAIYFFTAFVMFLLFQRYQSSERGVFVSGLKRFSFFVLLLCILSSGLIASYLDILPYFARNTKVDLSLSLSQNTTIQSWISMLLPFGTVKGSAFFENDIALRNNYFSLILSIFFLFSFFVVKSKQQWFFLLTGIFFFILSLGGSVKLFAHNYLPLIGYVRVNGEFRIFAILCFIIVSTQSFHFFTQKPESCRLRIKLLINLLVVIYGSLVIYTLFTFFQGQTGLSQITANMSDWRNGIKATIDKLEFSDTLLIQCLLQIPLLILSGKALLKQQYKRIVMLTALDVIIATLLNLPFTGVGKVPVAKIDAIHQQSPQGIPQPLLQPLNLHDTIPNADSALVGDWSFYNKQIGKSKPVLYPVKIMSNYQFYEQLNKDSSISVADLPFLFISPSIANQKFEVIQHLQPENIISFSTNELQIQFNSKSDGYLIYLQNYYPHWKYKSSKSSGEVIKAGPGFMAVPLKKGFNSIQISFDPQLIKNLFILCAVISVLSIVLLLLPLSRRLLFK